jgi:hypothetical protein
MDERKFNARTARLFGRISNRIVNMPVARKVSFISGHEPGQSNMLKHLSAELREAADAIDAWLVRHEDGWHVLSENVCGRELADVMFTLACANYLGQPFNPGAKQQDMPLAMLVPNYLDIVSDQYATRHPDDDMYVARHCDGGPKCVMGMVGDERVEEWKARRRYQVEEED